MFPGFLGLLLRLGDLGVEGFDGCRVGFGRGFAAVGYHPVDLVVQLGILFFVDGGDFQFINHGLTLEFELLFLGFETCHGAFEVVDTFAQGAALAVAAHLFLRDFGALVLDFAGTLFEVFHRGLQCVVVLAPSGFGLACGLVLEGCDIRFEPVVKALVEVLALRFGVYGLLQKVRERLIEDREHAVKNGGGSVGVVCGRRCRSC